MPEWWTYSLSDFLMFSPRTYYRLFELYNLAIWPAQILAVAIGLTIVALLRRGGAVAERAVAAFLALGWLWVAAAFLLARYDTINWAGRYFAAGFAAEALLIAALGLARVRFGSIGRAPGCLGVAIFLFALLGYPLIAAASGRAWSQAEFFGLAPDPTAIGTLGLLLAARGKATWCLRALPILWCVISGATLWAMGAPEALLPPAAALLTVLAAGRGRFVR